MTDVVAPSRASLLRPFLPRLTFEWLAEDPDRRWRPVDGTVVFVDISGFTKLSEKLAKAGRVGAEEMADAINRCFTELLAIAYEEDGSLLKFGGDALFLLFSGGPKEDHAVRAVRAAAGMRKRLREVGKIQTTRGTVGLRMSIGVHTGTYDFFLAGESHHELLVTGPGATQVVTMEGTAEAGEILLSPSTAACLPSKCLGDPKGPGVLLRAVPPGRPAGLVSVIPWIPEEMIESCIPVANREALLAGSREPEHRQVSVAFLHFDGTDEMRVADGPEALADALHELVVGVQSAVDELQVSFLASDVDADGGKIILIAGVPRAVGEDDERMLLALRRIADAPRRLSLRIGVTHGGVFAGDIGPRYRRTYTVMGDTVNLAARLMAKATPGGIYATAGVLERSAARFEVTELEPFMVKGKAKPVEAWSVGSRVQVHRQLTDANAFSLLGREREMATLGEALASARGGRRRLVDVVGEAGIGKSRLLHELRSAAEDFRFTSATAEAYTQSTPYIAWRDILRDVIDVEWDDPSEVVVGRLRELAEAHDPSLLPWLPLVARAADAEMEDTPEVRDLAAEFVRPKLTEVVEAFLCATVRTPTLFVIEDAHYMDEASADLLTAIVTTDGEERPWLFCAVGRPTAGGFEAPNHPVVERLEVGALEEPAAIALAEAATEESPIPDHVLQEAVRRAAGNPQLILDLLRAAVTGGGELPDSVEAAATVRIDALPPKDRLLVRRVSVFGLAFHPRFLGEVLEDETPMPDDATWLRLEEFFEDEAGGYLRFRRAVVRDAAYAGLPFRTRRRLHGAVGHRMERETSEPDELAELLSMHFSLAREYERAWRYALVAARRAQSIFANVEAATFYARAIEAGRKVGASDEELLDIVEGHGEVLWRARIYQDALRANAEGRWLARNDPIRLARLMMKRSVIEEKMGRLPQALRWLSKGRGQLSGLGSKEALKVAAELDARYASGLQAQGKNRQALVMATRAIEEGAAAGSAAALGDAENMLAAALAILGKQGAIEHWQMALRHFEESKDLPGQAMVLSNLGVGEYFEGRWSEAVALYQRAQEASERLGDPAVSAQNKMNIAEVLVDQGYLQEAEQLLKETSRVWRATGDDYLLGFCLIQLGRIAGMTGRTDEAIQCFEQARQIYLFIGAPGQVAEIDAREVESRLLAGDAVWALQQCGGIISRLEVEEGVNVLTPLLDRLLGYALLQAGDLDAAADSFRAGIASARERGAEHDVALSLQGLARVSRLRGEPLPDLEREAGEIFDRLGICGVPAFPVTAA